MKKTPPPKKSCSSIEKEQPAHFYPAILESIAEGIVVIGVDKRILYINRMAKSLIGIKEGTLEGTACNEVIRTELCTTNCPFESDNDSSCDSHFMNIKLYKKDNSAIPLCLNVATMNDEEGRLIGIIENFRPMSEAVKVIESLEESNIILSQEKRKIDSIINSLADGVFTVDKKLCLTSFNRGMEKLTGLREADVVGKKCGDVLNADICESDCPLACTLRNGFGMANVKERIIGREGGLIPVFMSTAFLKDGERDEEIIAIVRDASEIEKLKKEMNDRYQFSNIIGKSVPVQKVFELIEALHDTDCAVLIEGESGTGKELVARAIHHESDRRNNPFVKVDCSAIVEGLFESELFGHVKGAFTGAIKDKVGKFQIADGGTVFLDEIGEMPVVLQTKLLRVIQDKAFERVGDTKTVKVDLRVIAATNKNLLDEIRNNSFREDLYYRLCIVPVKMPPLRERKEDIPLLVEHFLDKCSKKILNRPKIREITPSAMSVLMDYSWPGNIRELENAVEHAYIRSKTKKIDLDSLPPSLKTAAEYPGFSGMRDAFSVDNRESEEVLMKELLRKYQGKKAKVAAELGLSRTTLWRKFKKYGIKT